jgi:hypothetical protein
MINIQQVGSVRGIKIFINGFPVDSYSVRLAPFLPLRIFAGPINLFSIGYWKQCAIACVRIYPRYKLKTHRKIFMRLPKEICNSGSLISVKIEANGEEIAPFITRELALDGFMPSFLDLNLDYDLRKNWSTKDLILAFSNIQAVGGQKTKVYSEAFTDSRSMASSSAMTPVGGFELLTLRDATVFHGQFIANSEYFFPADSIKSPPHKVSTDLPTINWVNDNGKVFFPKPFMCLEPLNEAIFIGGTNNWMHFVIEDLPRIIKLRVSGISPNIPIILRADLSPQIKEAVSLLTDRAIILLKVYSSLDIAILHYFYLNNPLSAAMRGDSESASQLFDQEILTEAAQVFKTTASSVSNGPKRVLIAREPNLFRPMSNFRKLRFELERDFGFKTYFLGSMSLQEIIESLKSAEVVVGEYGAGLANILFTPPGAKVIELRGPAEAAAVEYEILVKSLGHKHFKVLGSRHYVSLKGIGNGQFSVNLEELKRILGGIIESS